MFYRWFDRLCKCFVGGMGLHEMFSPLQSYLFGLVCYAFNLLERIIFKISCGGFSLSLWGFCALSMLVVVEILMIKKYQLRFMSSGFFPYYIAYNSI